MNGGRSTNALVLAARMGVEMIEGVNGRKGCMIGVLLDSTEVAGVGTSIRAGERTRPRNTPNGGHPPVNKGRRKRRCVVRRWRITLLRMRGGDSAAGHCIWATPGPIGHFEANVRPVDEGATDFEE